MQQDWQPLSCCYDTLTLTNEKLTAFYPYQKARIAELSSIRIYPLNKTNLDQWLEQHSISIDNHSVYAFGDRALYRHDSNVYVGDSNKIIIIKYCDW